MNAQETQWADLMRAGLAGDAAAYHRLLAALAPALRASMRRGFARVELRGEDVEDVVQEALLAVHLKRHTWDVRQPLLPWVRAIARNKMIDSLRRKGKSVHIAIDELSESLVDETARDAASSVELADAVSRLKGRDREIVVAMSVEGITARDLGQKLGMSEGAVRVALHRALRALGRSLGAKQA